MQTYYLHTLETQASHTLENFSLIRTFTSLASAMKWESKQTKDSLLSHHQIHFLVPTDLKILKKCISYQQSKKALTIFRSLNLNAYPLLFFILVSPLCTSIVVSLHFFFHKSHQIDISVIRNIKKCLFSDICKACLGLRPLL